MLANWTSVLNGTVSVLNAIAQIPGTVSIPLAAGQRGSLWFIFSASPARAAARQSSPAALASATTR